MERWSIELEKEALKFSAAHFLLFPDGTAERLHGHNYRVYVEIEAALSRRFGLVMDFKRAKPLIRELVDELDEHWLVPGENPALRVTRRGDGITEVRFAERYYAAPDADVIVMPMNNISAENLATWVGRELHRRIRAAFEDVEVRTLRCAVEETPGQRGAYLYTGAPTTATPATGASTPSSAVTGASVTGPSITGASVTGPSITGTPVTGASAVAAPSAGTPR
jgi:6-pyruvoyltetrahydropterin/6-carboxytetrahydropterin synthase